MHCTHLFLPAKCGQTLSDAEAKSFAVLHYEMKENKTKQNKNYISNNKRFMPMESLVSLWGQGNLAHESRNVGHPRLQAFKVVFNYMALTL